ncbi:MoxR-like ATPase [Aliivibrio finisterrensis]|uniref:zinc-dependent metalloprotease n=1 Tax=Aliivibrio finisterrensis TaxID=511998 RepID=UPI0010202DDE|nr:zinc-dependent metalloprotease [Aliivibrio finisterrensis]RYU70621.1 MoxR-like ATPase [Aliivibrio finisterrensis]RYU74483.1 MoxR-like ATPase [Aliivibrio finisterrensis]RYU77089.1 MoxR-like ATPase [Aliivibrio finisterrensis]
MIFRKLSLAAAITATLTGCAPEEQEYDALEKDVTEVQVQDLRLDGRWFYAPTTGAAPRFAVTQFPFLQGMGRYVELCFSDEGLEVRGYDNNNPDLLLPKDKNGYCLPQDQNNIGSDDQVNFPHVMTIPGSYAKYQCREDSYGDCTNTEEKDSDPNLGNTTFRNNTHFTPSPESTLVSDLNWDELYGTKDGLTPQGSPEVISWEFDPKKGVLNFELEQTFKINFDKLSRYMDWSAMEEEMAKGSFKARFYYSLVHESHLASEDYQPILYPVNDENDIGFFTTTTNKKDPTTNKYDSVTYLNRFNPNKETIKYYLSDNFFEEKNKLFLDSTINTINKMNDTLRLLEPNSSKPMLEIANKSEALGIHPGDLRYNVINLVDEPLDNGLLGYGPSIASPVTGEIIKAHVNQYSGVARTGVPYYWDNMARLYNRGQLELNDLASDAAPSVSSRVELQTNKNISENLQVNHSEHNHATTSVSEQDVVQFLAQQSLQNKLKTTPTQLGDVHDEMGLEEIVRAEEERIAFWSENNVYPIEASWVSSSSKAVIDNLPLTDEGYFTNITDTETGVVTKTLKPWALLPDNLQAIAADAITVTTYANTLVHEIGHNVGLRHNFKGSNDIDNYLSKEQSKLLGLSNVPAYSSTMDYAPSMLDEIPTWGLYDLAAFKFAYARKLDLVESSPMSAEQQAAEGGEAAYADSFYSKYGATAENESLMVCAEQSTVLDDQGQPTGQSNYTCDFSRLDAAALNGDPLAEHGVLYYLDDILGFTRKAYGFCTDGNVSLNSDCNRFDEGTNLQEIATYKWQQYLDSYDSRNAGLYRDGTYNSDYPSYIIRRFREMNTVRDMIEDSERIDQLFHDYGDASSSNKPTEFLHQIAANPSTCVYSEDRELTANNSWLCDYAYGSKKASEFFLDVLRTPESQCIITDRTGAMRSISLGETLSAQSYKIPSDYDITRADCFDDVAKPIIESLHGATAIHAGSINSKFLNSVGSFDPANPYSNAISVLGMWPDKGLASYQLARRFSFRYTDETAFASLLDLPGVKVEYDAIMAHIVAEEPLTNAVEFVDSTGASYEPTIDVNLHVSQLVEALPPMPSGIKSFYGLASNGRTDMSSMILYMGTRQMQTSDYKFSETALLQRNSLTKQLDQYGLLGGNALTVSIGGINYTITKDNTLANRIASKLFTSEGYAAKIALDNTSAETLTNILDAWQPVAGFKSSFHTPILALDAPFIELIVNSYKAQIASGEIDLSNGMNNQIFNAVINGVLSQPDVTYDPDTGTVTSNTGKEHTINNVISIIDFTMAYVNASLDPTLLTASYALYDGFTGADESNQFAWTLTLEMIKAYQSGDYTNMVGEHYEALRKLPTHKIY